MLSLRANGIEKQLKDEFIDVTLNELAAAYQYIGSLSPEMKRYLLTDSEAEVPDDTIFEYKIHWISLFSDLTKDDLRLIPIDNDDSLSVNWLYDNCELFLHQPQSYKELKEFKHKGKQYNILEPLKTIGGAELLFGKGNYRQFMLGSQLATMVNDQKNDRGIQSLKQLFALLYSDGDDSSEGIIKRSHAFGEVNALYGWSAYFFFVQLVKKYNDYFRLSMTKNPTRKIQKVLAKQQLRQLLSRTIFGRSWLSKWLNKEFLILTT